MWVGHSLRDQYLIPCQSLALGRPPSIRISYVDCELPEDDEAILDENGKILVGCAFRVLFILLLADVGPDYRWKYEFIKDIISSVLEQTLTAEAPQYRTILELDRKIREKALPPHLNVFMSPEEEHFTPSVYMRGCILGQFRAVSEYIFPSSMLGSSLTPPSKLCCISTGAGSPRLCWTILLTH